jgi:hypothetical protein
MVAGLPVVYFNNCHNRDHVSLFGSGAFFDLATTGRQGAQARNLHPGQPCVVAERATDKLIVFGWYSFSYEALLPNELGDPDRVYFGRLFYSETMPEESAATSDRYAALFRSKGRFKGNLKIGSVFHKVIPAKRLPSGYVGGDTQIDSDSQVAQAGAGFGDPAENRLVEVAAIREVVKHYKRDGWSVRSAPVATRSTYAASPSR